MMLLHIISIVIYCYLAFNVGYLLIFSISGLFNVGLSYTSIEPKMRIVILIPAYKEDRIILETARTTTQHNYPIQKFDTVIIADQLQKETLNSLYSLPVKVLEVSFEKSTKAKALKQCIQWLPDEYYDIVFIMDADNILTPGCLEKLNHAFHTGAEVVQLHRTAKNLNTATAILDAASEEINNHIFRKGHRTLGLSSAMIGSGMAFKYNDFKELMIKVDIDDNPAEDREIYLELLKMGKVCEYIDNALVYDEKVQSSLVLEKQRVRWLSAQLQYARRFWKTELTTTLSHNIHYLDYAVQTLLLPRILLLGVTLLCGGIGIILSVFSKAHVVPGILAWILIMMGMFTSLGLSVFSHIPLIQLTKAMTALPMTFWKFLKASLKSSPNQKEFIHTPKGFIRK